MAWSSNGQNFGFTAGAVITESELVKIKTEAIDEFKDGLCESLKYDFEGPRDLDSMEEFIDSFFDEYAKNLISGKLE